jgi:hypothetical protein
MITIYKKDKRNKLVSAIERPFQHEEELEKYVMSNTGILSDIFIIKRRVVAGTRKDIPDMVGVDRDNNIVIIENKNVQVSEDILPQILRYAIWAQTNPDSIKAMWLESVNRPEDIEIDWDNISIRLIVLAPSIKQAVTKYLNQINYKVELIEVKRYQLGKDECIVLNKLEQEQEHIKTTRGLETYNEKFYKSEYNVQSVDSFYSVISRVDRIVKRKKWNLEKKFNKGYIGYKIGFFNVFGVHWLGSKSFGFFLKFPKDQFKKIKKYCPYEMEYDDLWNQGVFKYTEKINVDRLARLFQAVYDLFAEK